MGKRDQSATQAAASKSGGTTSGAAGRDGRTDQSRGADGWRYTLTARLK